MVSRVKEIKGVEGFKMFVNKSDLKIFRLSLLCAGLSCVLCYSVVQLW